MRQLGRLLRPVANQTGNPTALWQDPIHGYWETHGKMEFKPGEDYNLSDEEKQRVLWRYRVKEILKKEYLRREFDPHAFKYRHGVVMDPAMFRWYATDMTLEEHMRYTPRTVFLFFGCFIVGGFLTLRFFLALKENADEKCFDGEILWWDRQKCRAWFMANQPPCCVGFMD